MARQVGLTLFNGRAADCNDRAMLGAPMLADALQERFGGGLTTIGAPEPPLARWWHVELAAAMPALQQMADHYDTLLRAGLAPVTALSRCTVALATVPVVARHRPDAVVVWFDAHADLNTPGGTTTGYLGGMALSGPAGLWQSGLGAGLATSSIVLVGARDIDPAEQLLLDDGTILHVPVGPALGDRLQHAVGRRAAYVHLDCDVLEPGIVPTEYSVAGGLSLQDLADAAEALTAGEVVGLEVGEFEGAWAGDPGPVSPGPLLEALEPLLAAASR